MKGDQVTQDKLKESGLAELLINAEMKEIKGKKFVNAIVYKDKTSGEERELAAEGVFVAIGMIPNSDFLKGVCDLNQWGEVVINPRTNATSHVGVFAAGDITDVSEKQTIIAAGHGVPFEDNGPDDLGEGQGQQGKIDGRTSDTDPADYGPDQAGHDRGGQHGRGDTQAQFL